MNDPIHERGKTLEDIFFAAKDQQLLENLKKETAASEARKSLSAVSGIQDEEVLNELLALNINPETLAAVGLIPLVSVAWADGTVEAAERRAIMKSAEESGIHIGSGAQAILEQWLTTRPEPELLESWKHYIAALKSTMDASSLEQIQSDILQRAETVARAAGGLLGLVYTVSDSERKVLDELNSAFE